LSFFLFLFFCFGFLSMDSTRKISKHEARGRSCCFPCAAFVSCFQCFCYCFFFLFFPPFLIDDAWILNRMH
jgi:amino acid transporter